MNTKRSCGVLLPLFSLPSEYGIGTLGKAAYDFIDFLAAAGQSWWQLLPVGPAGSGDSPYNSFSSFAGNAYFIDLDMLVQDGLLTKAELAAVDWGNDAQSVDYEKLRAYRMLLLRKAARRGLEKNAAEFDSFCRDNASWLSDYALYMALKEHFGGFVDRVAGEYPPSPSGGRGKIPCRACARRALLFICSVSFLSPVERPARICAQKRRRHDRRHAHIRCA